MVAAAAKAVLEEYVQADIDSIELSENRQRFTEGDLDELGANMKAEGQHVPCEAWRISAVRFKLNDGGRRLKAAKKAGIKTLKLLIIPEPSAEDQLRRQLVPQGLPLHAVDESRIFAGLKELGFSADEIAASNGVKVEVVKQRLVLQRLSPKCLELYYDAKLTDYIAYALARIPVHEIQDKAAKKLIAEHVDDGRALWFLRRFAVLPLAFAPWSAKDAIKVDGMESESCEGCTEHTLAQRDLWGDLYRDDKRKNPDDFCLVGRCYEAKMGACAELAKAEAEKKKIQVLTAAESKKSFNTANGAEQAPHLNYNAPWSDADQHDQYMQAGARATMKRDPDALAIDPDGRPRWLYSKRAAQAAERKKSKTKTKSTQKKSKADIKHDEQMKAEREKERRRELVTAALIKAASVKARKVDSNRLVIAVTRAFVRGDYVTAGAVAMARGLGDGAEQLEKRVDKLKADDASELLVEMIATLIDSNDYNGKGWVRALAEDLGVDIKATGKAALKATPAAAAEDKATK